MATVFVSYTSADTVWANWIGRELRAAGHTPRLFEWELKAGDDIGAWMKKSMEEADHVLSVITPAYFKGVYAQAEFDSAWFHEAIHQRGFLWQVIVKPCELPRMVGRLLSCFLYRYGEEADARAHFRAFIGQNASGAQPIAVSPFDKSAEAPTVVATNPSRARSATSEFAAFPGGGVAESNIRHGTPRHFVGREELLVEVEKALARYAGPLLAIALVGMRGVGKSTAAVAFAERRRDYYRATWQIRAETVETMTQDLIALGVRLGWLRDDEGAGAGAAVAAVLDRLSRDGTGVLLIYDNAISAADLAPFLPRGGGAHVLITSNAPEWGEMADPISVALWPENIAADFLLSRTKRSAQDRPAAEALARRLGCLPLALEVAAAYCERLKVSPAQFKERFDKLPAPRAYADRHELRTVSATFGLAIREAEKLNGISGALVEYAALLAPDPVPLFLFEETDNLAVGLAQDGLDDVMAALLTFAVVDRVQISDERDSAVSTDCMLLHRLVREVAADRVPTDARDSAVSKLIEAVNHVYPEDDGLTVNWPRARRLDPHVWALVGNGEAIPAAAEVAAANLMEKYASHRAALGDAQDRVKSLLERGLALRLRHADADVAKSHINLALYSMGIGEDATAVAHAEKALQLRQTAKLQDEEDLCEAELTLARALRDANRAEDARTHCDVALAIQERLAPEGYEYAYCLTVSARIDNSLGLRDRAKAQFEHASRIFEAVLGPDHPATGTSLINLAGFRERDKEYAAARGLIERALEIHRKKFGDEHRLVAYAIARLAGVYESEDELGKACELFEQAAAMNAKTLAEGHVDANWVRERLEALRTKLGR